MHPRYWTDNEGTPVGEWVEVTGTVWSTLMCRPMIVYESYTNTEADPGGMWTVWGEPDAETPTTAFYSKRSDEGLGSVCLQFVPLVEDHDSVVAGPRRGPDPLPDVPAPDYGDGMPY